MKKIRLSEECVWWLFMSVTVLVFGSLTAWVAYNTFLYRFFHS